MPTFFPAFCLSTLGEKASVCSSRMRKNVKKGRKTCFRAWKVLKFFLISQPPSWWKVLRERFYLKRGGLYLRGRLAALVSLLYCYISSSICTYLFIFRTNISFSFNFNVALTQKLDERNEKRMKRANILSVKASWFLWDGKRGEGECVKRVWVIDGMDIRNNDNNNNNTFFWQFELNRWKKWQRCEKLLRGNKKIWIMYLAFRLRFMVVKFHLNVFIYISVLYTCFMINF